MRKNGLLVVISAPSGGGKTTVIREVLRRGNDDFCYSVSATTREQRPGEVHGKDYFFLSAAEFEQKKRNHEFVEWAEVHGHFYGTLKAPLDECLREGKVVFLDLDVHGGLSIKKYYGDAALLIFIQPPSFNDLKQRLMARNTETAAQIEKRLQRYPVEMKLSQKYDFVITNFNIETTVHEILEIVNKNTVVC